MQQLRTDVYAHDERAVAYAGPDSCADGVAQADGAASNARANNVAEAINVGAYAGVPRNVL